MLYCIIDVKYSKIKCYGENMKAVYQNNIEFNMYTTWDATYPAHYHTHLEIMYILKGSVTMYMNGNEYVANENDVIFILPHQIHSFVSGFDNEICILHISHTALAGYSEMYRENELENPIIPVLNKSTYDVLKSIQSFIFTNHPMKVVPIGVGMNADKEACQNTAVKTLLLGYVALLLDGVKWVKKKSSSTDISKRIIEYCYENYRENISLCSTAEALGVYEHTITRTFSSVFKCNFREYVNNLRLSAVVNRLMTTNAPITEIAFECGFETLRTFNRVFMSRYNMTPTEFRKEKCGNTFKN